jgi:hypothetical protein
MYGGGILNGSFGTASEFHRLITLQNILCQDAAPAGEVGPPPGKLCNTNDVVGIDILVEVKWFIEDSLRDARMQTQIFDWS